MFTDVVLFILGFNFVFGNNPKTILNVQIILNAAELLLRIFVRKGDLWEWICVYRNFSNAFLISVLFMTAISYFSLCGPNGPELQDTDSCDVSALNGTMHSNMDGRVVGAIIFIRICILIRISLVMRNFTWDYLPKRYALYIIARVNQCMGR